MATQHAQLLKVIHGQRLQRREKAVPICKQQILRLVVTHRRRQSQEQRNDNPINTVFIVWLDCCSQSVIKGRHFQSASIVQSLPQLRTLHSV
jgi:hypothetical protein